MFMNNYSHKGGIRINAINYLSSQGLPCDNIFKPVSVKLDSNQWETAKIKFNAERDRYPVTIFSTKIFNVPLKKLHKTTVHLKTGQELKIPRIVHEMCKLILRNVETEGIFQRAGSKIKQEKIRTKIEERGHLNGKHLNVVDVAVVLRYFLRTLPEPLIPYSYHDLFLSCCDSKNKREALIVATLLLPIEHLNLLTYLMQFFNEVASYSRFNKMNCHKLAMCIASDMLPVCTFTHGIFHKTNEVIKLLIKESHDIGMITTDVQKRLDVEGRAGLDRDNKMMTVFNGFKKFLCHLA